eukprot:gb/GEZN01013370.1/.p1 GENE.gb/GEZN01013370.1/~~gb/GEZN01013370.1/.p1  ORF type:complete len:205 (+),score=29.79 gb/GEZN01013370.1/:252-866(+)
MEAALRRGAAFLVSTCCFYSHLELGPTKHGWWGLSPRDGKLLCKLAELQGERETASSNGAGKNQGTDSDGTDRVVWEAMHTVNALRLGWCRSFFRKQQQRQKQTQPDLKDQLQHQEGQHKLVRSWPNPSFGSHVRLVQTEAGPDVTSVPNDSENLLTLLPVQHGLELECKLLAFSEAFSLKNMVLQGRPLKVPPSLQDTHAHLK